jgi:hypothetical protein
MPGFSHPRNLKFPISAILYATEFRLVILEVAEMKYMDFATEN